MAWSRQTRIGAILLLLSSGGFLLLLSTTLATTTAYIMAVTSLFIPGIYFTYHNQPLAALLSVFVAHVVRLSGYITRRGLISGIDNYVLYRRAASGNITAVSETAHVALTQMFMSLFAGELQLAWTFVLIFSSSGIIVAVALLTYSLFGGQIASLSAVIVANDFTNLLFSPSLVKTNIPIIAVCLILYYANTYEKWPKNALMFVLLLGTVIAMPITSYTGAFLSLIIFSGLLVALIIARIADQINRHQFNGSSSQLRRPGVLSTSVTLITLLAAITWGLGLVSESGFNWHLELFAGFLVDLVIGAADTPDSVGGNETSAFLGSGILGTYNWMYRLAMLSGCLILLREVVQHREFGRRTAYILIGAGMTGLPVVWLFLPTLSGVMHAGRVSRWALIFYAAFIAVTLLNLIRASGVVGRIASISVPRWGRVLLVVGLISLVVVAPSGLKTSANYSFDEPFDRSTDVGLKTAGSNSQLHVWRWTTSYTSGTVAAPGQFNKYGYMTGDNWQPALGAKSGPLILKQSTLQDHTILSHSQDYQEINYNPPKWNHVYADGQYVVLSPQNMPSNDS